MTPAAILKQLKKILDTRFHGVISIGEHAEDGECCILELESVRRNIPWTDDPEKVNCWDIRSINDACIPDSTRTSYMLRALSVYADSMSWNSTRQRKVVERIIIAYSQKILAKLPGLSPLMRKKLRECKDIETYGEVYEYITNDFLSIESENTYSILSDIYDIHNRFIKDGYSARYISETTGDIIQTVRSPNAQKNMFIKICEIWIDAATKK